MDGNPRPSTRASRAIERAASRWLARHSLGTLGAQDREEFEDWLYANTSHSEAFERLSGTLRSLDQGGEVVREADRRAREAARACTVRRTGTALAFACVALVGALTITNFSAEFADLKTDRGEKRVFVLADGSRLILDANSAVNIDYARGERRVGLVRGRVHVEVKHGEARPFRVTALGGQAEDVGTAFDVSLENDTALAVVTQGEIFARSGGHNLPLHKGEAARWRADEAPRPLLGPPVAEAAAWRYGRLVFDRRPLSEVIATLDRYADKPIWLLNGDAAPRRMSGVIRAEQVEANLASLVRAQGLKVRNVGVAWVVY